MKKVLSLLLVAVLMCNVLAACSGTPAETPDPGAAQGAEGPRDVLRIGGYDEEWVAADLIQGDTFYDIQMMMAEPLFLYDAETGELQGCLGTTPVFSDDGKTMTFEVPEGRTFANGAILDAEDVKASLEHGIKDGEMSDTFSIITNVETDGNKVIVTMSEYSTALMILLVSPFFCVIDTEQLETMSNEELFWGAQPFGAYYIDSYMEGAGVVLKRNDGFKTLNPSVKNKEAAYIPTIEVKWYFDEFAMISAFETGELDVLIGITEDSIHALGNRSDAVVNSTLPPMVRNLQMNANRGPLTDYNVRLAISLLINRDNIVDAFGGPLCCTPAYGYITKNVMFHTPETYEYFEAKYANDTERAMQLLADAGWSEKNADGMLVKDGKTMQLVFNTASGKNETAALAIQMQLRKAGLDITLVTTTETAALMQSGDYDLSMCNYWWSEPGRFLVNCYRDHNGFDETEYRELVKRVETTTDNELRFALVDEAQRYLMDKMVVVPLYTTSYMKILRDSVAGDMVFIVDGLFTNDCK